MADIINLNRARKAKARADSKVDAAANRAKFGRSKAQRTSEAQEAERLRRALDGTKRDP